MCGIAGIYQQQEKPQEALQQKVQEALKQLIHRGPDGHGIVVSGQAILGHRRLAILDTSEQAAQPMLSPDKRYALVYNGEIYNYRELRKTLTQQGHQFQSTGDTEVLLHGLMAWGLDCLSKLNGFFAFAFYDKQNNSLLLARDRFGIKPLYYQINAEEIIFASELAALYPLMSTKKVLNEKAFLQYLHLNYVPFNNSILRGVQQVKPGYFLQLTGSEAKETCYYDAYEKAKTKPLPYNLACEKLEFLISDAVKKRLAADVALGAFLSGGIDSSVIVAMASRHRQDLHTFSIGFKDSSHFDETAYAREVAEKFQTRHTAFSVSQADVIGRYQKVMDNLSEPFADSSALVVNLLSELTREQVTVALSGDGGDEIFAGYHKHKGEWQLRNAGLQAKLLAMMGPLWAVLPKGRGNGLSNRIRQFDRFAKAYHLSPAERYWQWAGFTQGHELLEMLHPSLKEKWTDEALSVSGTENILFKEILQSNSPATFQELLEADRQMVLPGDMLVKTDRMSMAQSLEVRVPLLDHRIVDFVKTLSVDYLIDGQGQKKILRDSFRKILPASLYNRPKQGFEVPLRAWLLGPLQQQFLRWSDSGLLEEQGIFNAAYLQQMMRKLRSSNPGDMHARLYGFLVFQEWWFRYMAG